MKHALRQRVEELERAAEQIRQWRQSAAAPIRFIVIAMKCDVGGYRFH